MYTAADVATIRKFIKTEKVSGNFFWQIPSRHGNAGLNPAIFSERIRLVGTIVGSKHPRTRRNQAGSFGNVAWWSGKSSTKWYPFAW